jgi:hypothetical protein
VNDDSFALRGVSSDSAEFEVESSVKEQMMASLKSAPTSFTVPFREDRHAWERAHVFFQKYMGAPKGQAPLITKIVKNTWVLSNRHIGTAPFRCEVKKREDRAAFGYHIACEAGAGRDPYDAHLNAQNLARFIRDGRFEVSLINDSTR